LISFGPSAFLFIVVNSQSFERNFQVSETSATQPQAFCTQCGRPFAVDNLVQFGQTYVCADCKPTFLQRMREGATAGAGLRYASFGLRFLAVLIDGIVLLVAGLMVNLAFGASAVATNPADALARLVGIPTFINLGIGFAYYTFFLTSRGATLGKMAVGVKIVTPDGGPISFGRAAARYFCANYLEIFTLWIGYLIALFDDQNRTLHDRICGTRAIAAR
jgi:uncharacterized RDD family membrane protein YckC